MDNDEYGFITSNKDQNAIITTLDHISQVLQDNAQSETFSYQVWPPFVGEQSGYRRLLRWDCNCSTFSIISTIRTMWTPKLRRSVCISLPSFHPPDIDHKSFKEEEITPELVAYANKLYFFSFFFLYSLETPWLALWPTSAWRSFTGPRPPPLNCSPLYFSSIIYTSLVLPYHSKWTL